MQIAPLLRHTPQAWDGVACSTRVRVNPTNTRAGEHVPALRVFMKDSGCNSNEDDNDLSLYNFTHNDYRRITDRKYVALNNAVVTLMIGLK